MNLRLAKLYLALAIFCCASYLLWMGMAEWIGRWSSSVAPFRADTALLLGLLGMGIAGRIGWKTILEELAVRSD
jgi:hypothetical protein